MLRVGSAWQSAARMEGAGTGTGGDDGGQHLRGTDGFESQRVRRGGWQGELGVAVLRRGGWHERHALGSQETAVTASGQKVLQEQHSIFQPVVGAAPPNRTGHKIKRL